MHLLFAWVIGGFSASLLPHIGAVTKEFKALFSTGKWRPQEVKQDGILMKSECLLVNCVAKKRLY
jgi:hypothetical protein